MRAAARVTAALCVATASVLLPAPASSAADQCVAVVVDARQLGAGVRTGCAAGDPGSGLEALTAAGFRYAFAPRQPGLVCQVDGAPACDRTTTTTYWSYWYRARGSDTWVYASEGAGSHDPEPGSTEAWVWQEGGRRKPPGIAQRTICPAPADSPAPGPVSAPSKTAPKPGPTTRSADQPSPAATSSTPRTAKKAARPATATGSPSSGLAAPSSSAVTMPPATTPAATPAAASSRADGDGAPWTGPAVGAALVAALGAAAFARSRRSGP